MATGEETTRKGALNVSVLGDYGLILLSGFSIGYGASSFLVGVGVILGLTAIYKPERSGT